jgi:predicted permease
MRSIRAFFVRLYGVLRGRRGESDFASELDSHLQLHIEDNLLLGMSPEEARRDALRKLGGIVKTQEAYRERGGLPALETLAQDIRYGLRQIAGNRAYAAVAVLTLALGIGANTAIFSIVNAVVLRPLPYPGSDKLLVASLIDSRNPTAGVSYGVSDYVAAHQLQRSFTNFAGASWADSLTYTGGAEPLRVHGTRVTAEFFSVLGVSPVLGRAFAPGEDAPGHEREVVLSHRFWRQHFASDPRAIGHALALDGESYVVVGVMPADFHFSAFGASDNSDLWPLLQILPSDTRYPFWMRTIGRLKPGVTETQARLDLSSIARDVQRRFPASDFSAAVTEPLKMQIVAEIRTPLLILLGAVGLVLLIATVNVANLEIARMTARGRELAVRAALGAGRGRIARQVLTESALVALLGGVLGLILAYWGVKGILALAPSAIPRLAEVVVDRQVLAFTAAASLLSGLFFGLAPALHGFGRGIETTLRGGGQNLSEQRERRGLRKALVVFEVSLSLVLLISAALLLRSFERLTSTNPGFNPKPLVSAFISLPSTRYKDDGQIVSFYRRLIDRVQNVPGVMSAGITMSLPPDLANLWNPFWVPNGSVEPGKNLPTALETAVSPGYFHSLGVPLLRGRLFEDADRERRDKILIVNDSMARRYFSGQDPVGQRIKTGDAGPKSSWETIVGVVADVKYAGLDGAPQPTLYVPYFQTGWPDLSREMFLVVRCGGDPKTVASSLQAAVRELDRDMPLADLHSMNELLANSVSQPRFRTLLLAIFAALALVLSAIGIFGVMAYLVDRRTQEIGVRMALGASRREILRMVMGEGLRVASIGIGIGLIEAFAASRLLKGLLFEVQPADPATFAGVSLMALIVALIACYVPARQAMSVDPMVALRHQ